MSFVFINPVERRLRAGWRILLQGLLFLAGMFLLQLLIGQVVSLFPQIRSNATGLPQVIFTLLRPLSGLIALLAMGFSFRIASRHLDRRVMRDYGFHFNKNWWLDLAFGLVLGAVLMAGIFAVELALGWVTVKETLYVFHPNANFWLSLFAGLLFYVCVGIYEEMLSRGYQMRNLAEGLKLGRLNSKTAVLAAYLLSSSVFGLLHLLNDNSSLVSTLNLVAIGLFLGFGYFLTGELAIPIGLHITWNFFQGNVFGFPVSGGATAVSVFATQQGGPDLWTGAAFGPEAGLIGLVAILVGFALTALWVKLRYGRIGVCSSLAVYAPVKSRPQAQSQTADEAALSPLAQ